MIIGTVVLMVLVLVYMIFRTVEIRIGHKGLKSFGVGIWYNDNSCTYYDEYSFTIALVVIFITVTFTK